MLAVMAPPAPRIVDYEVLDQFGCFDLCPVYRGRQLATRREVAVKVFPAELVARVPTARERFLHQAQLLARMSHPSVIGMFGSGELDDGTCYLISELLDGEPLSQHLRVGPLPVERALRFARQLAVGLRCVHEVGAILRDVKPSVVMLFPNNRDPDGYLLKIVDASLAEIRDDSIARWTRAHAVVGTPIYMSPEQARGDPDLDARSDIYGFGVVLYEMLAGRQPFTGESVSALIEAHLNQPPASLRGVAGVSAEVDEFVLGCLAKVAADRSQDMAHVIAALDRAIAAGGD